MSDVLIGHPQYQWRSCSFERLSGQAGMSESQLGTGFLYGYSVYTTFRFPLPEGILKCHWERLICDATYLDTSFDISFDDFLTALQSVYNNLESSTDWVFRITVVPVVESHRTILNANINKILPANIFLSLRKASQSQISVEEGLLLKTVMLNRVHPTIKHGSMVECLHARKEAIKEGFDDILFVDGNGYILEASTSNCFFVCTHHVLTAHPQQNGCLPGVTRKQVIEVLREENVSVDEEALNRSQLSSVTAAFLTNAVSGVIPVKSIDDVDLPWLEGDKAIFKQATLGL